MHLVVFSWDYIDSAYFCLCSKIDKVRNEEILLYNCMLCAVISAPFMFYQQLSSTGLNANTLDLLD